MHRKKFLTLSIILVLSLLLAGPSSNVSARPLAADPPDLGDAASFSVLGHTTVTNTGPTTMPGDLGVWPGSAVTHFPPGIVGPPGHIHKADTPAHLAQTANSAAFDFLDAQACDHNYGNQDLTLISPLGPGVYCAGAFTLSGNLTLSGAGLYIFKSASTLITSSHSSVTNGDPCNTWWRVASSATIGTYTTFIGNILAHTDIELQTGASLDGRALAYTAAVTLDSNTISGEECLAAPAPVPAPTKKATSSSPHETAVAATAAALAGVVPGLPGTGGGAPIRNEDFPWSLVIVGGFSALALVFGVRAFRRTYRSKQ
jgi:type VI secretion system secreted protein VgrG